MELVTGTQSAAQRYAFFAQRQVAKIPDIEPDTEIKPFSSIGVIGAGTMGGGISMNFANVGIPVTIIEQSQENLDKGLGIIRKNYENTANKGRITFEDVEKRTNLIKGSTDINDLSNCDLIIEAVFENMDLKKDIFKTLDDIAKKGSILATNTSALDINEIANKHRCSKEKVIEIIDFNPKKFEDFIFDGLLKIEKNKLSVFEKGRLFTRNIAMRFDPLIKQKVGTYSNTI